MNRKDNLSQLKGKGLVWDIAVIGGGASGLGVALDALSRGLSVALFEKADFAKGTSSRSTKLLHGGVRYLAQGDVFLVLEALRERGRILENAPHLSRIQPFVIPVYTWIGRLRYSVGLKLYDLMSGKLSLGKSRFISSEETIRRLPHVKSKGLKGGVVYHDGEFDDARMALSVAQTCDDLGGCLLNYAKVNSLIKDENGRVIGLKVRDTIGKKTHTVHAKMIVNATGVFADKILKLDQPDAKKMIQPSQGIHLVLDPAFLGGEDALMIPKTVDGRVLFAVPWQGKLVVGTTDTLREKAKMEPEALSREVDFVLKTAGEYLTVAPQRKDVLSVYAGLRPLAAPKEGSTKTKEISRDHKVIISSSKLVTLTGGKWTTFRKMGEDTVDYYTKITGLSIPQSESWKVKMHGYSKVLQEGHWQVYGGEAKKIQRIIEKDPALGKPLHHGYPYTGAEVIWAVREEMAHKLEDVLSRRIRILMLDAKAALEMAPLVVQLMAEEMGKGETWKEKELTDFRKVAKKYLLKP